MVSSLCAMALSLVFIVYQPARGEYVLRIQTSDFANPANTCAECEDQGCCDVDAINNTCSDMGNERCDDEFFYCLRPLGTPVPTVNSSVDVSVLERSVAVRADSLQCLQTSRAFRSEVNDNSGPVDYSSVTLLGHPNPLEFQVNDTEWKGIQLYVDVIDSDSTTEGQLIDVFTIDIQPSDFVATGGDLTSPRIFKGVFELAFIELRFECEGCVSDSNGSINFVIVGGAVGGGVLLFLVLIISCASFFCVVRRRTERAASHGTITVPMINIRGDHQISSYALYSSQPPVKMSKAETPVAVAREEGKTNTKTNMEISEHENASLLPPTTKEEEGEEEGEDGYDDDDDYEIMTAPQLQRPQAIQERIYDNLNPLVKNIPHIPHMGVRV